MATIADTKTAAHYLWGSNCDNWVLADTDSLSLKQESMPSGTREKLHIHDSAQQFFYILNGTATFNVGNETVVVETKQGLLVKPGTKHFISNDTDHHLDFLVVSQPGTNNDRVNLEE